MGGDQVYRTFQVIHTSKGISYIIELISFMAGYIFALLFGLLLNPQKRKAMEKIIFLGIAMWLSLGLTDGFPPERPVRKPFKPHVEFSKHEHPYIKADKSVRKTNKPESIKIKRIIKDMDPG
jgi:hypothetical protein